MVKSNLHCYLHYYKWFHLHAQAQDFGLMSVKGTKARMIDFKTQNPDTFWIDAEFLEAANSQLVECRRVLKYSYAIANYLQDNNKKTRFEYHHLMLKSFTENLLEHTEKPIKHINRTELVNQVRGVLIGAKKSACEHFFANASKKVLIRAKKSSPEHPLLSNRS